MKAVKVAVSTAMRDVSAAPRGMSATMRGVSAALHGVSATPCGMLAGQDTPGQGWYFDRSKLKKTSPVVKIG